MTQEERITYINRLKFNELPERAHIAYWIVVNNGDVQS